MNRNDNHTISSLNDLIRVNNDRTAGYEKAIKNLEACDVELKAIFSRFANQSREFAAELVNEVIKAGGEPATGTSASGKIYRMWMDVKATFSGDDRQAMLKACEFGEDAILNAYSSAQEMHTDWNTDQAELIDQHKLLLNDSHDLIKKYRDNNKLSESSTGSTVKSTMRDDMRKGRDIL